MPVIADSPNFLGRWQRSMRGSVAVGVIFKPDFVNDESVRSAIRSPLQKEDVLEKPRPEFVD